MKLQNIPPCTLLVFEEVKNSFYHKLTNMDVGHLKSPRATVSLKRWEHVRRWHVVLPPEMRENGKQVNQYYCVSSARLPHYQVASTNCGEFLAILASYLGKSVEDCVHIYGRNAKVEESDFMLVLNDFDQYPLLQEMATRFDYETVARLINKYHERDDSRGNRFFDRGYAGWQNRKRDVDCAGLVLPSKRSVVDQGGNSISKEDDEYCSFIELLFYQAMKEALPSKYARSKEDLYMIPPTNGLVIRREEGSAHQYRYAMASESLELVVGCHIDSQNPTRRDSQPSSEMNCPVGCLSVFKGGNRCSLIAYGRESVVVSAMNIEIYRSLLDDARAYFDSLVSSRREVSCEVVRDFRLRAEGEEDVTARVDIHTNKMVYFSPYIDTILRLTKLYRLDVYDRICLLYCCILSEKPDPFLNMCRDIEREGKWFTADGDFYTQFSHMYYRMFDKKSAHQGGVPRHQPSANVRANQAQLKRTGDMLVEAHHSAFSIPVDDRSEPRNFSIAVSVLSGPAGVHHAGQLLSQHLLVIGACVGIFPEEFLEHGHICDDNDKIISRLEDGYSIYSKGEEMGRDIQEVGYDVLVALSHHLDDTAFVAENTLCEFLKGTGVPGPSTTRKDTFFHNQTGLFRCNILRNPRRPVLELVTDNKVIRVSIPEIRYDNHKVWAKESGDQTSFFTTRRAKKNGSFNPIKQKRAYRLRKGKRVSDPPPSIDIAASCLPPPFAFTMRDVLQRKRLDATAILREHGIDVRVSTYDIKGENWYGPTVLFGGNGRRLFALSPEDEGICPLLVPCGSMFGTRRGKKGCLLYDRRLIALECAVINYLVRYKPEFFLRMWAERNSVHGDDMGEEENNFVFISSVLRNNLFNGRGQGRRQKEPAYALTEYDARYLCLYACDECGVLQTNHLFGLENRIVFVTRKAMDGRVGNLKKTKLL